MKLVRQINFDHQPLKIKFSRDGSHLLAASRQQIVSCLIAQTSEEVRIEAGFVLDVAFLSDEEIVAAIWTANPLETRKTLAIFDIKTQHITSAVITGDVRSVCVHPQRKRIFAGRISEYGTYGYIGVYDFALNQQNEFKTEYIAFEMAISYSDDKLAIANGSGLLELWNISTDWEQIATGYDPENDCTGNPCEVCAVDITPDGRYAVVGLYGGKNACFVIDGGSGDIVGWYGPQSDGDETFIQMGRVAISPDGSYVAIAPTYATTVCVYRVSDGTISHEYEIDHCEALAFSPIGDILAIGGEKSVTLWSFKG
ncbi:MAG: hypothetical protein ABI947_02830 [Chloroflexota bacterium]